MRRYKTILRIRTWQDVEASSHEGVGGGEENDSDCSGKGHVFPSGAVSGERYDCRVRQGQGRQF